VWLLRKHKEQKTKTAVAKRRDNRINERENEAHNKAQKRIRGQFAKSLQYPFNSHSACYTVLHATDTRNREMITVYKENKKQQSQQN